MNDDDFNRMGKKKCSSLKVVLSIDDCLGGPHFSKFDYGYKGSTLHIEIDQYDIRTIHLTAAPPITMEQMWDFYSTIERLLMLFDGRFCQIDSAIFTGDAYSEEKYALYAHECLSRRLSYYKTDPRYCRTDHVFLIYNKILCPELLSKWVQLQGNLDIAHQVALYNIADTGITCDVKCANFIECFEPMVEIISIYEKFFLSLKPDDRTSTLKTCIDAVISKYGHDIFSDEYYASKDKFLQVLVNTRNRIMHIKRNQQKKYLSGEESILYLIKLCHLYRVVLLSLLGVDYAQYQPVVVESVKRWNTWEGIMKNFINTLK